MDWKIFGTAFLTLFLAELGDKTQLAVITMTASTESKISVFLGASLALIVVTALGVLIGGGGTIAATEGKELELPQGTVLRVRLDSPLQVQASR
jgi:putative Ca2+/H+ antiporter (TMEM165/GDT1 family)